MKTNNEIYNKKKRKIKKSFFGKKKSYKCIFHCDINANDCINSIDLIEDKVVFGTLMGDVLLCRVDENKLNVNYNNTSTNNNNNNDKELHIIKNKNNNNSKLIKSSLNKTDILDSDQSNIKINNNNTPNNKYDCIQLSVGNNNNDENSVKIYENNSIKINLNSNLKNNDNNSNNDNCNDNVIDIDDNIYNKKDKENKCYTDDFIMDDDDDEEEDENSNKYEKKLRNKNKGKTQSSNNGNNIKIIDQDKLDTKLFNEKKKQKQNKSIKKNEIKFPQITKLILRSKENIPCVEFENNDIINISIGDLEVIRLENMSTFNINDESSTYNYSKLRNYKTENEHIECCENCTCMMGNSCFLIIFTHFANYNSTIEIKDIKYENKNLKEFHIVSGTIKMSNYAVPFDFDGDQFLFLDYMTKDERRISVVFTSSKKEEYHFNINKNFGHISHMKLLPNNKIFLCRNNKECEIHLMNEEFGEIEKWIHKGEDVISSSVYICNKNINENEDENDNLKKQKFNKKNEKYNTENFEDENDFTNDKENDEKSKNEEKNKNKKKVNILKLANNNSNFSKKNLRKSLINSNPTLNIKPFVVNIEKIKKNLISGKKINDKNLISSNNYENNYIHTDSNQFTRKKLFINNLHSLNPSYDNSSRREINITIENKKLNSYRHSKSNSISKYNLITSDKKKKNSKNSVSSIEIYSKKKNKNANKKKKRKKMENDGENEEDLTVVNDKDDNKYSIITLDKNGNVNKFKNKKQKTLFNLYNINNIDNKYKTLEFFAVGFPYYIIVNELYYCITTDHGLFVFSKISD